ncbi:MAG: efflux RND transporter permease subunit [Sedimentisphaerales bacterium]|nr:efflux RND transporter permease subunit [Sedimentisphaerales bacterium]
MKDLAEKKGILGWFASNHVAANLLMVLIIVAGLLSIFSSRMEVFPELSLDMITITVPYLGASPEDVEEGVCLRVEEAIAAVDGIKRMTSSAGEGAGMVLVEVDEYADTKEVLDDIKAEVDTIITFPEETEKPIIAELKTRHQVITVVVYGDASEKTLRILAEQVRNDLTAKPNISQVSIAGVRPYEISIEVSEENLRRYNLSIEKVSMAVRNSSLDIPAGSVKTSGGEILVRTKGQKYYGPEFDNIIVFTRNDGTKIRLCDIATVRDDFEDVDLSAKFDGKRAALIQVTRIGAEDALDIAKTVKQYIEEKKQYLPAGISLALWEDDTQFLKARMDLLTRNAYVGLVLVFLCLTLFLNFRLAFWTTMGIPISFLGALYLIPHFGVSINMISLFAFIMSLGLVVDDAIVIGENIFAYRQAGMDRTTAAIKGVKEMCMPVILAVLTTMFAFIPLAYTLGIMGKILRVLPIVVVSVLSVSLLEALLILPAHLSSSSFSKKNIIVRLTDKVNIWTDRNLKWFVNGPFAGFVLRAVKWRYITLAVGFAIFVITVSFIAGGYIKFVFFDAVEADNMIAMLTMPLGTPVEQTAEIIEGIEKAAFRVIEEFDGKRSGKPSLLKHISTTVGAHPTLARGGPVSLDAGAGGQSHLAEINVELLGAEERDVSTVLIRNRWRELVGEIPGVSSLTFMAEWVDTGNPIEIELAHQEYDVLLAASEKLKGILRDYTGVSDIADDFEPGKAELKLSLKDTGRTLGLTLSDLARQVRQGFYGDEVQRIQRGRDDIRVMVRYPEDERKSLADVENMRIRLPGGTEIPFSAVAEVKYGRGYSNIRRVDRRRVVSVSADVDESVANAGEINRELKKSVMPALMNEFQGLQWRYAGEERERNESLGSLIPNFGIAMMAIYALLAVQFRSYSQPVIVMSAIPFGIVGATIGHLLMGFNLSILSMFGIVALSGVVVNDSLIMIDLINRERRSGIELGQILRDCATRRFRPIMLTTLTTFCGLLPMIAEKSLQARFLVPMAISLAFGVMFATCITLVLVPSLYMVLEDFKSRFLARTEEVVPDVRECLSEPV